MSAYVEFVDLALPGPSVLAIGTFDGVHLGHQRMLAALRERADALEARAVVVAFDWPPRAILRPDPELRLLTAPEERAALLRANGADVVALLRFDRALAARTAADFASELCRRAGMVELLGGPDLAFGRGREGTPDVLAGIGRELGFAVRVLPQLSRDGQPVRSDAIRQALREGDVRSAAEQLGRPYALAGLVVHGDARGRSIGVPTANIEPSPDRLVPAHGVYAVRALVDGREWPGVMNVGVRPTVDGVRRRLEVHLLGFDGDLYDRRLEVRFVARLREERRFASLPELVAQIQRDVEAARQLLG